MSRTYFFDECTSHKLVSFLASLREATDDYEIVHIRACDTYGIEEGSDDTVWMPQVAELDWIVVTVDNNIRRRKAEREQREALKLRVVYLHESFARMTKLPQAEYLIRSWLNIVEATMKAKRGECFDVMQNHRVKPR